ncbi:MAG TPA: acylphosphatase, partial [Planctomycetota bacterium]
MRRVRFVVVGRVQGVAFRACTQKAAQQFGIVGFVQNRADGAVEGQA